MRPSWNKWQQFLTFRCSNIANQKIINLIYFYFQKNQKVKKQKGPLANTSTKLGNNALNIVGK